MTIVEAIEIACAALNKLEEREREAVKILANLADDLIHTDEDTRVGEVL